MPTYSKLVSFRGRAVVVTVLACMAVLASVGVGHAAAPSPGTAAAADGRGGGKVCADGKRDDHAADGVCTRDKDGGDGKGGDGKGGGKVCADGKRDDNPADGLCTRDGGSGHSGQNPDLAAGTPCAKTVRACVDLGAQKAWLIQDAKAVRGPVSIASGGPGHETPRGMFTVRWKSRDHHSAEYDNAPMPFAVFFTDGGVAFHQGDLRSDSHGCVRLAQGDAEAFFNYLSPNDPVQVV